MKRLFSVYARGFPRITVILAACVSNQENCGGKMEVDQKSEENQRWKNQRRA